MKNYLHEFISILGRIFEETFPVLSFLRYKSKLLKSQQKTNEIVEKSKCYVEIDNTSLKNRISEEHARAVKIDEKTYKFTLGLSVSLTVLAAASGAFAKYLPKNEYSSLISVACGVSAIYMLLAGMTALGSLKTLPTYGYGSHHRLKEKSEGKKYLAVALYSQEKMNIIRHLRNEAAYQSLRNGFLVLLLALVISVSTFATNIKGIDIKSNTVEKTLTVDRDDAKKTSKKPIESTVPKLQL